MGFLSGGRGPILPGIPAMKPPLAAAAAALFCCTACTACTAPHPPAEPPRAEGLHLSGIRNAVDDGSRPLSPEERRSWERIRPLIHESTRKLPPGVVCMLPPDHYYTIDLVRGGTTETIVLFGADGEPFGRWSVRRADLPRVSTVLRAMIRQGGGEAPPRP